MDETCDAWCGTKTQCDPFHPWHCCHFAVKAIAEIGGRLRAGIKCLKCGKKSRSWIPVSKPDGPVTI